MPRQLGCSRSKEPQQPILSHMAKALLFSACLHWPDTFSLRDALTKERATTGLVLKALLPEAVPCPLHTSLSIAPRCFLFRPVGLLPLVSLFPPGLRLLYGCELPSMFCLSTLQVSTAHDQGQLSVWFWNYCGPALCLVSRSSHPQRYLPLPILLGNVNGMGHLEQNKMCTNRCVFTES